MNKIYYVFSIFITGLLFCLAYMPQSTLREDKSNVFQSQLSKAL
jgi:hypothetical protein